MGDETREERIRRELATEARIRAEAAAERTKLLVDKLRSWGRCARNGGPDEPRAAWYFDVAQEFEELAAADAFLKPGSTT